MPKLASKNSQATLKSSELSSEPCVALGLMPSAKRYASQGQQRSIVLAAKVAELAELERRSGKSPVLLLDDVSSELDRERNAQLMEYLASLDGQVLLSTTDASLVAAAAGPEARFFRVRDGVFTPIERPVEDGAR